MDADARANERLATDHDAVIPAANTAPIAANEKPVALSVLETIQTYDAMIRTKNGWVVVPRSEHLPNYRLVMEQ
jgi:hypothetical protein